MKYYIGNDFHKQYSFVGVLDEKGEVLEERKLFHVDEEAVVAFFTDYARRGEVSVSIEATPNWYWFVDRLQALGIDVKLVHARKAKIIAESAIKTDRISAITLAHMDRLNFLPQAYIADRETRAARELLRYRMSLVKVRVSLKNRVHVVLSKNNIHHSFSDLFGKRGLGFLKSLELPAMFRMELVGYLRLLDRLEAEISDTEKEIRRKCKSNRYAERIMTAPGFSYLLGLLLSAEIADIGRFSSHKKLCCYGGLASSIHQSGDKLHHGHIIKQSNKYIRYALVEAAQVAIKKDPKLQRFYKKVERRKGSKKARIAVARKLLVAIYYMLKYDKDYCINRIRPNSQVSSRAWLGT